MTSSCVTRRVVSGRWRMLRRGAFCLASTWDAASPVRRHWLASVAALLVMGPGHVVSHASAAALHGLPLPFAATPVWLTRSPPGSTRYLEGLTVEVATLPRDQRTVLGQLPVTSLARTVADCLRHLDEVDAVAVGDAALRRGPGVLTAVEAVLGGCAEWPYAGVASRRVPLLDGRRESALESWSYVVMHRCGLPLPEPQKLILDRSGRVVARADGWWEEYAAVGEVDGKVKYGNTLDLDPEKARLALIREKEREDDVRSLGATVIRWGSDDLQDEKHWARWMRGRLDSSDPSRFVGSAVSTVLRYPGARPA